MLLMLVEIRHPGGGVRFSISQTDALRFYECGFLSHLDDLCVGLDNFVIKMSNMVFVLPLFSFFAIFLPHLAPLLGFIWLYGTDPGDREYIFNLLRFYNELQNS